MAAGNSEQGWRMHRKEVQYVSTMAEGLAAFYEGGEEVVVQLTPKWFLQFANMKLAREYIKRMERLLDVIEGGRAMSPITGDPHEPKIGTK